MIGSVTTAPRRETSSDTSSDDEAFIDAFAAKVKIDQEKFVPLTLREKMNFVATYVAGLVHIIRTGICHGDLKPSNILWQRAKAALEQEAKFVISDFGGSKIIDKSIKKMSKKFILDGEADKGRLKAVVVELYKEKPNPKIFQINAEKVDQLVRWNIVTKNEQDGTVTVCNKEELDALRGYLGSDFLPAKTESYECKEYTKAACDYFWRGEEPNFKNALHALDIRAAGLTIYRIFTNNDTPTTETDKKAYYDHLEVSLRAKQISAKAVSIIRKMAEPMPPVDIRQVREFPLPVTLAELELLRAEMAG